MAYVNPGNRAATPVPRAAGRKPPTVTAPRYVNPGRRAAMPLPIHRPPARPPVRPPARPPVARPPSAKGPAPLTNAQLAQQLTDQQHAGDQYAIDQQLAASKSNYQAAIASLHDWGQQIQANWQKYSGLTNAGNQAGLAQNAEADQNIAGLFGESNMPEAARSLQVGQDMLQGLASDQAAFSGEMEPILQQAQMDLAGQATHAFQQDQSSLQQASVQLQIQKANDYVKNYQDLVSQGLDTTYKQAQLSQADERIKLERERLAAQKNKTAGTISAADKFQTKIGADGSITYVYGDGRIVKAAPPGTVPQRKSSASTGSWSTKVLADGSVIQTNSKSGAIVQVKPPGSVLKPPKQASGLTQAQQDSQRQKALHQAEDWYHGVAAKTRADGSVITPAKDPVPYQQALKLLATQYPHMTLRERMQILDNYYQRGEGGRPYLNAFERDALVRAGVSRQKVGAAIWDPAKSAQLRANYPGVIARANANPKPAGNSRALSMVSGVDYPLPSAGNIIGVPHQGTHNQSDWQSANAIDIASKPGTPVYAVEDGTLSYHAGPRTPTRVGSKILFGDQATITGSGNSYFYTHLRIVKSGRVHKGDLIGYVDNAGSGSHLHIASEKGDPRDIFKQ